MASASVEASLAKIFQVLALNSDLQSSAAAKLAQVAADLEKASSPLDDASAPPSLTVPAASEAELPVIQRLKNGFLRFKENYFLKEPELFGKLAKTQEPKVLVVACSDSRVSPSTLFGVHPGELFVIRNVANMVPTFESSGPQPSVAAAMEYAVKHLGVEEILVLGHRNCGGVKALMTLPEEVASGKAKGAHDFVEDWVSIGLPARSTTLAACSGKNVDEQCRFCEKEAVNVSLSNLLTYPWIKEKVAAGKLGLHGWYYDFVDCYVDAWALKLETSNVQRVPA